MPRKKKDYSTWTKEELIEHVRALEKRKKYGLVWDEEKTKEHFEKVAENSLPVLKEVKNKEIKTDKESPTHILIEGDNYHALSVLSYTHEKSVDVIYIDPPYNIGNGDFRYNDRIVDREDAFRHSKWLSFMYKRLSLAKKILKDTGIIIISIDDTEVHHLELLMDDLFLEKNFLALLPTIMNLKGNQDQFGFAGTHEYTLIYAKSKKEATIGNFSVEDEGLDKWEEDERGFFKQGANLKATGKNAPREKRENLYYPIYITDKDEIYVTDDDDVPPKLKNGKFKTLYPITDGKEMSWRWEKDKVRRDSFDIIVVRNGQDSITLYKKQRPALGDIPTRKPKTLFYKPSYSSGNGTAELKEIFGGKPIENPKPLSLIWDLLFLTTNKYSTVVDFFAGSGTTGHAVLDLNKHDKGKRQFILCTNNENNICTEVCYPRIQKVMKGYTTPKGKQINGLGENLKYYRTDFVPAKPTDKNKELLTRQSTEMLCLRENTFETVTETDTWKIYKNQQRYTGILFDQLKIPDFKKQLVKYGKPVSVYVFSLEDDDFAEEFQDMKGLVKVCSIPEAILRVYRRIFK